MPLELFVLFQRVRGGQGFWARPDSDNLSPAGQLGKDGLTKQLAGGLHGRADDGFVVAALCQGPLHYPFVSRHSVRTLK